MEYDHFHSCMALFAIFTTTSLPSLLQCHCLLLIIAFLFFLTCMIKRLFISSPRRVYMVDFSCYAPPPCCRVPHAAFIENATLFNCFTPQNLTFMSTLLASSGLGPSTSLPPPLHYIPPTTHLSHSLSESHTLLFPLLSDLLSKTDTSPASIDVLVVTCSGFSPVPSLASMIVNRFCMRDDVKSFNLSGMGCSGGAIGVDLVRMVLTSGGGGRCGVVVSTEVLSSGWYWGRERSKLVLNCLFRTGSAAALMSTSRERRGRYEVVDSVRTGRAWEDRAYVSALREENGEGIVGVNLTKDLMQVARDCLRDHISVVGAKILPLKEKARYILWLLLKRSHEKPNYVPNFKSVVQHFCVPTSAKAMIKEIGKGLRLGEGEVEAAMATLHRFGNQSSSSLWYQLEYLEKKGRVKEGDLVWQLGMGSGPKCCSVIWRCLKSSSISSSSSEGAWSGCIDRYPSVIYN